MARTACAFRSSCSTPCGGAWDGVLAVRLSVTDWARGGVSVEDGVAIARALVEHGCDLVHTVAGQTVVEGRPEYRRGFLTALSDRVRAGAQVPTLVGGHLTTLDDVNTIVGAGRGDLCIVDLPPSDLESELPPAPKLEQSAIVSVMTEFAQLAYPDAEELLAGPRKPVLLLPLGATEPHGPHGPLETDTLISLGVCRRAAERLADDPDVRALVLPPLPYGVTRYGAAFPGAVSIGEATLRLLIVEIAESLAAQGFPRIVLVNSHLEPEQVLTLREAVAELGASTRLLDLTRRRSAERLTDEFRSGSCHAGRYETSLVLADEPGLVRRERMVGLESRMIDMPAAIAAGQTDFMAMGMDRAYCGAPAEASAEEGEQTFETLAELVVELVREVAAC